MTSALPTSHTYDQLVGPFYDTSGLGRWLGVSSQAIATASSAGTVISCPLDSGNWVYPVWQFTESGTVRPDVLALWAALRATGDRWTCAVWLRSPQQELGNRTTIDWICGGGPLDVALALARADAQRWGPGESSN